MERKLRTLVRLDTNLASAVLGAIPAKQQLAAA